MTSFINFTIAFTTLQITNDRNASLVWLSFRRPFVKESLFD